MKIAAPAIGVLILLVTLFATANDGDLQGTLRFRRGKLAISAGSETEISFPRASRGTQAFLINYLLRRTVTANGFGSTSSVVNFNPFIAFEGFRTMGISVFAHHAHAHGEIITDEDNGYLLRIEADPFEHEVRQSSGRVRVKTITGLPVDVPLTGSLIQSDIFLKLFLDWKARYNNSSFNLSGEFDEDGKLIVQRISPVLCRSNYTCLVRTKDVDIPVLAVGYIEKDSEKFNIRFNSTLRDHLIPAKNVSLPTGERALVEGWHARVALGITHVHKLPQNCKAVLEDAY